MCSRPLVQVDARLASALRSWLDFHLALGVDHVFVYDHDGSAREAVAPYLRRGVVTRVQPPQPGARERERGRWGKGVRHHSVAKESNYQV